MTLLAEKNLLLGEFNIHVDVPSKSNTAQFIGFLGDAGLQQHIREPTHGHGHTLDLLISRPEDCLVLDSGVSNTLNSDHYVVNYTINFSKPNHKRITSISRNYRNLGHDAFTKDLQNSFQAFPYNSNLDIIVIQFVLYNSTVLSVLDNHYPLTTRTHKFKTQPIWYTKEIHSQDLSKRQNPNFTPNSFQPLTLKPFSRP